MRIPVQHRLPFIVAAFALSVLSCGREVTGPENGIFRNRVAMLAFAPEFSGPMAVIEGAGDAVPFEKVRVVLRGLDGSIVKDTMVAFPSDADEISLALSIAIPQNSPAEGLPLTVTMAYVNAAGDTVFRGGPNPVVARPVGSPGAGTPVTVPVTYDGAGKDATRVAISPKTGTAVAGQTLAFSATAFDAADAAIPNTPFVFSTPDATRATVDPVTGVATWLPVRGVARVIAELPNGARADTANFTVSLPASKLVLGSGGAQTGAVNAPLADTIVVRTLASDDVPVEGVVVSFAVATGAGTLSVLTDTSDANGDVKTAWTLGAALGTQTITATSAGLTGSPLTISATAVAATPVRLEITQEPTGTTAGALFAPQLTVIARDAFGNAVPTFTDGVTVNVVGAEPPTLLGTTTRAAVGGTATFDDIGLTKAGAFQLVVSSGSLASDTTATLVIEAAEAAQLAMLSQPPMSVAAGATFSAAVDVQDAFGNRVTDWTTPVQASFELAPTGATFVSGGSADVIDGVADFTDLQLDRAGNYRLRFTSGALTATLSNDFAVLAAGPEAMSTFAGDLQTAAAGSALPTPLAVVVSDNFGNPISGVTITWTVTAGGGSMSAPSSVTDSLGRASVTWTLGSVAGAQLATASAGFLPDVEFSATATAGAATHVAFISQPDTAVAGAPFPPTLYVEFRDAFGNRDASLSDSVTMSIESGPPGGELLPANVLTQLITNGGGASAGQFAGLEIRIAGTYVLRATTTGGLSGLSQPIVVVPNGALQFFLVSGAFDTAAVNQPFGEPLRVRVTDSFGNPVPGATTWWIDQGGGATFALDTVLTDADGYAENTATHGPTAVAMSAITAFVVGSADSRDFFYTTVAGAATQMVILDQPDSAVAGDAFSPSIWIEARDAFGNRATSWSDSVRIVVDSGPSGGVVRHRVLGDRAEFLTNGGGPVYGALGGYEIEVAGTYRLRVVADGGLSVALAPFTVRATTPELLAKVSGGDETGAVLQAFAVPLRVRVTDQFQNPVGGVKVAWVDQGGGAVVAADTTLTDIDGYTEVSVTHGATPVALGAIQAHLGPMTWQSFPYATTTAAPSALVNAGGDGQSATVMEYVESPLHARVTDAFGNGVSGVTVNFNVISGLATVDAASVATDSAGYAATLVRMDSVAGPVLVGAFAAGLTPDSLLYSLTALPDVPNALLVVSGSEQAVAAGDTTDTLRVRLTDAYGNPIAGATVTWDSPSGLTFTSASGVTDSLGYVSTTVVAGGTLGVLDVYARLALPELSAYFTVRVEVGPAVSLAVVSAPSDGDAGATLSPVIVELRDAFGHVARFSDAAVEIAVDSTRTPGALGGTLSVLADSGVAVFSNLVLTQAGPYALVLRANGLPPDTTESFTVQPGQPMSVEYASADSASGVVGGGLQTPLAVLLRDAYGNPVSNSDTYWFVSLSNAAQLDSSELRTDSLGVARATVQLSTLAETFFVTASAFDAGSLVFTVRSTNAPGSALVIDSGPEGEYRAGDSLPPLVARVRDAYGNVALDYTGGVTVEVDSGPANATLLGTTTRNATAGVVTFDDLALDLVGVYRLRVSAAGTDTALTSVLSLYGRDAERLLIVDGDAQVDTVGRTLAQQLRVRVTDRFGNPVSEARVEWDGGGQVFIGDPPLFTDLNGEMATSITLGSLAGTHPVTASLLDLPDTSVTFTVTAVPDTAHELFLVTAPETAVAGDSVTIVIEVRDSYGNRATGFAQNVTIEATDAAGEAMGETTVAADSGVATFTAIYFETAGNYFMQAMADGVIGTPISLDVLPGAASQLVVESGGNQTAFAGVLLDSMIVLRLTDAFANPIEAAEILVTRDVGTGELGDFTDSLRVETAWDGRVSFPWTLGLEIGEQTLRAQTETAGPIVISATALQPVANVVWIGNTSSSATDPSNWSTFTVPTATDSVLIPAGRGFYPTLTGFTTWGRLTVADGGSINLASYWLNVRGSVRAPMTGITGVTNSAVVALDSGTVTGGFPTLRMEGTHATAGLVRVQNNLAISGSLTVGTGDSLHVVGSVESFTGGALQQTGSSGIFIGGDFWSGGDARFGAGGRLHVYGDIRTNQTAPVDAIIADPTHELYLLPGRTQDISLWSGDGNVAGPCTNSCFGRIIARKEGTPYGVSFGGLWQTGPIRARGGVEFNVSNVLTSNTDLIAGAPSMLRTEEWAAFRRVTFDGALDAPRITADTLVALGTGLLPPQIEAPIIVVGDRQVDAELYGPVLVDGSLDVVGPNAVAGDVRIRGSGYLRMTEPSDTLLVYGELRLEGTAAAGQLTEGFLDILGNLFIGDGPAVLAEPNHTTRIRDFAPSIEIVDPSSSHLGSLLIEGGNVVTLNADGIVLQGDLRLVGVGAQLVEARPSVVTVGNRLVDPNGNLSVSTVIVDGADGVQTPVVSGNLVVRGRSVLPGNLDVSATLNIAAGGELTLDGHRVSVGGDFSTTASGSLRMQSSTDTLRVFGEAIFGGGSTEGQLTAGVLELHRSLQQIRGDATFATFYSSAEHTVRFVGGTTNQVSFESSNDSDGSRIGNLSIEKADGQVLLAGGSLYVENIVGSFTNAGFSVGTSSQAASLYVLGSVSPTVSALNRGFYIDALGTVQVLRDLGGGCTATSIRVDGNSSNFSPMECVIPQ